MDKAAKLAWYTKLNSNLSMVEAARLNRREENGD
jgi:hypothetical protein